MPTSRRTLPQLLLATLLTLQVVFFSCKEKTRTLFELVPHSGIVFENHVEDSDSLNILNYRNFYNGGGVAVGDINNDGLPDVFVTANQGANKLFLNKGGFKFSDISLKAGFNTKKQFSTGVVMADVNGDGWLDVYVCNAGSMNEPALRKNQLYINNHDLTFTESAAKYGLEGGGYSTQASFFDYDGDGDLDCFLIENSPVPVNSLGYPKQRDLPAAMWHVPENLKGGGDHLYRNDHGHYKEVTKQAGIHGSLMSFGLGITVGDINGDGYPDVYVSNDYFERDYLYINQRNGTFRDELESRIQHNSYASMGADLQDINNDGTPEIFTTDMLPIDDYRLKTTLTFDDIDQYRLKENNGFYRQFLQNTLQLNDGNGYFKDIACFSGVNASEWSWGALMFDADNDGYIDLYVCNGIYRDLTNQDFISFDANAVREEMIATGKKDLRKIIDKIPSIPVPNKMFQNNGNLKFSDVGMSWGFTQNSFSNGAAYGDLDNDGDLDLVINNVNEPAFVYRNNSREMNKNAFVGISLRGKAPNSFAVGSKIIAYCGDQRISREVMPSRGFQSSVDYRQIIGLGTKRHLDSLIIFWPDHTKSRALHPAINRYTVYVEDKTAPLVTEKPNPKSAADSRRKPLFEPLPSGFPANKDDGYVDFYREPGIPVMLSHEGPRGASADVDGDGLEDLYIGGTVAIPGQLYIQTSKGQFLKKFQKDLDAYKGFVDGPAIFFDANGDGYPDLLVCAGGNVAAAGSRELQNRLFLNDGKGNFTMSVNAFPLNKDNVGAVLAFDFDHDGDLDLFAGGRNVTGEYGLDPDSHIYVNNGKGVFSDFPHSKMGGIFHAGMVTGAAWANLDGNTKSLVITGEWIGLKIFNYQHDHFVEIPSSLGDSKGFWQCVTAADLDGDGKDDLVMGNYGENFSLRASALQPLKLWINDFDHNGELDKVFTRTVDGHDKPVFMKNELEKGLPSLKKQNLMNTEFALKSIQELFSPDDIKSSMVKQVNQMASCIAFNKGNGVFRLTQLPDLAQLSSVKCVRVIDVNNDGFPDLILGGNEYNFQPQLGRLDASSGEILLNDGKGTFKVMRSRRSGIDIQAQIRDIIPVKVHNQRCLVFLVNNEIPRLYVLPKVLEKANSAYAFGLSKR